MALSFYSFHNKPVYLVCPLLPTLPILLLTIGVTYICHNKNKIYQQFIFLLAVFIVEHILHYAGQFEKISSRYHKLYLHIAVLVVLNGEGAVGRKILFSGGEPMEE
jgi:hypothetical protein